MNYEDIVCTFCGTLCDDIEVVVENNKIVDVKHACRVGTTKFFKANDMSHRKTRPIVRENGREKKVSLDEAIEIASDILANSYRPLLYGWSSTTCEAIKYGVFLADLIGGIIDNTSTVCHGPSVLAFQEVGYPSCTLGEVKNRADLIIYWGSNPLHAHPRHLSRYSFYPRGFFRERGMQDRELIVVDVRKTDTAKIANKFIKVEQGKDYELISALRYVLNGGELKKDYVAGVSREDIYELAEKMKNCDFGVLFFGMGLTQSSGKHRTINNAISLVRDLNRYTKFNIMMMRGHYNVTGANEVLAWETGYPYAVDFSRGYPRYNPGETSAVDVLVRKEVDAALIVASDPVSHFPKEAVKHLLKIPYISVDAFYNATSMFAKVYIPTAVAGIECEGTAYRMDSVPIRVRKIIEPPEGVLSDEEVVKMIYEKTKEKVKERIEEGEVYEKVVA